MQSDPARTSARFSGRFPTRQHAAIELAAALRSYRGLNPLILAIPPGGVPIGRVLADCLDGELDVALVRQLTSAAMRSAEAGVIEIAATPMSAVTWPARRHCGRSTRRRC